LQLVRMTRGEISIPPVVRDLCYTTPPAAMPANANAVLANADILLIEMSTPIEIYFGDFILNQNWLREYLKNQFTPLGEEAPSVALRWLGALQKGDDDGASQRAAELRELLSAAGRKDELLVEIISEARRRHVHVPEMMSALREVQQAISLPAGIILHNFRYLEDGRPFIWPAGFKAECETVARELGIPTYDPAPTVVKFGVSAAMAADLRHYSMEFYEFMADEYVAFASTILGRQIDNGRAAIAPVLLPDEDTILLE